MSKKSKKSRRRAQRSKQFKKSAQLSKGLQTPTKDAVKAKSPVKPKTDPWEKDFLKEVEQAEQAAEVVEFDEEDLAEAASEPHKPEVVSETEQGGVIVELGNKNFVPEEKSQDVEQSGDALDGVPDDTPDEEGEPESTEPESVEYDAAADLASDADLKLLAETGVAQKRSSLLHKINIKLPWLKVILLVALIAAMAVIVGRFVESQIVGTGASSGDTPEAVLGDQDTKSEELQPSEEVGATVEAEPAEKAIPEATIPEGGTKLVALTFDDGPSGATTWRLLDILAEKQVRVTFFVLGNMVLKSPDLLRAELAAGHEVGSHTVTHANLVQTAASSIQWEVQRMNEIFQEVTGGTGPILLRPPYGAVNDAVRAQVGQPMILWTVDTEDWRYRNAPEVRRRALAGVFDGAIILMHDIHATTVDAVAGIIDDLRAAGYTIVTVSQLAQARGVKLQKGWTYGSFRP